MASGTRGGRVAITISCFLCGRRASHEMATKEKPAEADPGVTRPTTPTPEAVRALGPLGLTLRHSLDAALHPRAFFEVWFSPGTGEHTQAYTVFGGGGATTRVVRSTHRPLLEPDACAVYPSYADRRRVAVEVAVEGAAATPTTFDLVLPPAPMSDLAALRVDVYGTEVDGDRGDGDDAYKRRGTCTFYLRDLFAHCGGGGYTKPLLDWASVADPYAPNGGEDPQERGSVTVRAATATAACAPWTYAARETDLAVARAHYVAQTAAALRDDVVVAQRAMRGVAAAVAVGAVLGGRIHPNATREHTIAPLWCFAPGGVVVGAATNMFAGTPRGFCGTEAWFERQMACVGAEAGVDDVVTAADDDGAPPTHAEAVRVADACTLWLASQPYLSDHREVVDAATHAARFAAGETPTVAWAGRGNCKDDARAANAVFSWLVFGTFEGAVTRRAQRVARCFVPLVCFGAVVGPGSTNHVYGVAMPVHRAMRAAGVGLGFTPPPWLARAHEESRAMPRALLLEGTALVTSDVGGGAGGAGGAGVAGGAGGAGGAPSPFAAGVRRAVDGAASAASAAPHAAGAPAVWYRQTRVMPNYQMTTSGTTSWFYLVGTPGACGRRFWFCPAGAGGAPAALDAPPPISVPSAHVFGGDGGDHVFEAVPHTAFDVDLVTRVRANEMVRLVDASPLKAGGAGWGAASSRVCDALRRAGFAALAGTRFWVSQKQRRASPAAVVVGIVNAVARGDVQAVYARVGRVDAVCTVVAAVAHTTRAAWVWRGVNNTLGVTFVGG